MGVWRKLLLVMATVPVTAAFSCSCVQPKTLCSRLLPGSIAFVGRIVSPPTGDRWGAKAKFQIDEPLWGVSKVSTVEVQGIDYGFGNDLQKPRFVLALRGRDNSYYVDFTCCRLGLILPVEHPWVQEFRDNLARSKPATMNIDVQSNGRPIPGLAMRIEGPGFSWTATSKATPVQLTMPPGDYRVQVTEPHFRQSGGADSRSILPGACQIWRSPVEPTSMISGTVSADPAFYYVLEASIENRDESAVGSLRRLVYQWTGWGSSPDRWAMNSYLLKPDAQGRFTQPVLPGTYRMIAIPHKPLTYGPPQFVVRTGIEIAVDQQVGPIAFPSPATAAAGR